MQLLVRPFSAAWVVALALAGGGLAWIFLPVPVVLRWMKEGGPVEVGTLVLYLVLLACLCAFARRLPRGVWLASVVLTLGLAARELDLHKYFTDGMSVMKVSYFLGPSPSSDKLWALGWLAMPLGGALFLAVRLARPWMEGLRRRRPVAVTAATALVGVAGSKLADRSLNVLNDWLGLLPTHSHRALQLVVEEPLELCIPLLAVLALLQYRQEA